jgi:uncharacterized protein involved in exopolysaccharide biosynthesis
VSSHRINDVIPDPPPENADRSGQAWTLIELARTAIRRRRSLAVVSVVAMAFMAIIMMFTPNWYVSTASLLPSGKTDQMSALKEAVGIANPGAVDENSSVLFPIVLRSRTIADGVLDRTYTIEHEGRTLTIRPTEYFETSDPDELRQALADMTAVTIEKKTGDIHLEVESKYPRFSQALAQVYLEELEDFNLNRRRSMAKENVRYLEGQIIRTRDSLRTAEDALAEFRRHNADWAGNSNHEILSELTKLQREMEIKTAAYVYLQQQLEMARLDVQRDVPVTRVLDAPSLPTLKSRPRRTLSVLVAGFAAFMVTLCILLFQEYVKREKDGPAAAAYHDIRKDLRQSMPRASRAIRFVSRRKTRETVSVE